MTREIPLIRTGLVQKVGNGQGHGNGLGKFDRQDGHDRHPHLVQGAESLVHFFRIHFFEDEQGFALQQFRLGNLIDIGNSIAIVILLIILFVFFNNNQGLVPQGTQGFQNGLATTVFGGL